MDAIRNTVDEEILQLIMLQLVQALRYEDIELENGKPIGGKDCDLLSFLLDKSVENEQIAHGVHWHLYLEKENKMKDNEKENDGKDYEMVREYYQYAYDQLMSALETDFPEAA